MNANTIATKIVKNAEKSEGVYLDLRVTVSKRNVESYTWRASGEPAAADWHKSKRAARKACLETTADTIARRSKAAKSTRGTAPDSKIFSNLTPI